MANKTKLVKQLPDNEENRLENLSGWYFKNQLDFDKKLIKFGYMTIKPYISGPEGLEMGSGDGQMTQFLVSEFRRLTLVDGSAELLNSIPNSINLRKVNSLFEEFKPDCLFNTIIMAHILEHVEDPISLLKKATSWLAPDGKILIIVPNALSIHRLVAVKMGLLKDSTELNLRDYELGHRRVYTPDTLKKDILKGELKIRHLGGMFFKPLANQQIQNNWTDEMIEGFYELGKDFQENAAEIIAVCEK